MLTDRRLLALAIAAKLATPDEIAYFERPPTPDPLADLTPVERDEATLRACASGVWSEPPPWTIAIDGHPVTVPAGYHPRNDHPVNNERTPHR